LLESVLVDSAQHPVSRQALEFFCQYVLQHQLVKAQIRDQLLQRGIFFLGLPKPLHVARQHLAELTLPTIERLLCNPKLPAHLRYRSAKFRLLLRKGDLLLCVITLLHFVHLSLFFSLSFPLFSGGLLFRGAGQNSYSIKITIK